MGEKGFTTKHTNDTKCSENRSDVEGHRSRTAYGALFAPSRLTTPENISALHLSDPNNPWQKNGWDRVAGIADYGICDE
jgi:hypothetical protein